MTPTQNNPRNVDEKTAAKRIGMSVSWLQQARFKGRGPRYIKIQKRVLYAVADLDSYTEARKIETSDSQAIARQKPAPGV